MLVKTVEELRVFLGGMDTDVFAFDTETTGLKIMELELLGISLSDGRHSCYIEWSDDEEVKELLTETFIKAQNIIAHNITFDVAVLKKYGFKFPVRVEWFDTMVAAHLLDEEREKGLKKLVLLLFGHKMTTMKELLGRYGRTSTIPPDVMTKYSEEDALYTYRLSMMFRAQLEREGLVKLFRKIEMPFLRTLVEMETNGVLVDLEKVYALTTELCEALQAFTGEMYDHLDEKYSVQQTLDGYGIQVCGIYNFNSPAQLNTILFDKLGLPIIERTPSGQPSTGAITINALAKSHPFVDTLRKYRIVQKLLTSFFKPLPGMVDEDGRVRSSFRDTGTVTGRLSSSNPNLQQLPKSNKSFPIATRSCFMASPGKKMVAVDYSQQELRIMGQLTRDPTLLKSMGEGLDLHMYTANRLFSLGIEEKFLYKGHKNYEEVMKKFKKDRDNGKTFSFGIPYGMGAKKVAKDLGCSDLQAQIYLDKYFEEFPLVKVAMERAQKQVEEDGYVRSYTGRRRRFKRDDNGRVDFRGMRQSFNFLIQSFGADLIRIACIKLYNYARRNPRMGIKLLMTVHDEVLMECNEEYAEIVRDESEKILESCGNMILPLLAEANIGDNYEEAK